MGLTGMESLNFYSMTLNFRLTIIKHPNSKNREQMPLSVSFLNIVLIWCNLYFDFKTNEIANMPFANRTHN